jgi:tetratricopeptide (TPR) repeat protein
MVPGYFPLRIRVSNALVSAVQYVGLTIWPSGLAVFYPHPGTAIALWKPAAAGVLLLAISVGVAGQFRKRPYLAMGWLWYLGTLLPVIGLIDVAGAHAMADRYTYVPLAGLFLAGTWAAMELAVAWRIPRSVIVALSTCLIAIMIALSITQASYWHDSLTLFTRALEVTAKNPVAHNNLGIALARMGQKEAALEHYRKAADELDSMIGNPVARNNLASALTELGKPDEAIAQYRLALELDADCAQAQNNLGSLLANRGEFAEAITHYERALKADAGYAAAHCNLANALAQTGRMESAIDHYRLAIRLDPSLLQAHYNLGLVFSSAGKNDEAIVEYLAAAKLAPNNAGTYARLGAAKAAQKKFDEALEFYAKSLELEPGNAKVLNEVRMIREGPTPNPASAANPSAPKQIPDDVQSRMDLARSLIQRRKFDEAARQYLEVLKAEPSNSDAYFNLAVISAARGKRDDAIAYYKKVLELNPNDSVSRQALDRLRAGDR